MDSGVANRLRRNVVRQLGLRAIVNLVTGADVTVLLLALGIDFPPMCGVLAFFLTFIPCSGLPLAVAPAVVLALAEYGLDRALLIIAGVIVINILAESALSPTVLFLGFIFWARLLGGPGAFLAVPLTICDSLDIVYLPRDTLAGERHGREQSCPDAPDLEPPAPNDPASEAPALDGAVTETKV
jgi:AI-2 transport protein TqsA